MRKHHKQVHVLNLPDDILDALTKDSLEYTKAIAQIPKLNKRVAFLEEAIAEKPKILITQWFEILQTNRTQVLQQPQS